MRQRLLWLVPILESMVVSILNARMQTGDRELQVDLEEAYEHAMRARSAISRAARTLARRANVN